MSDSMAAIFARPLTWDEAFAFAHQEVVASFCALCHGDVEGAAMLQRSAEEARILANELYERTIR